MSLTRSYLLDTQFEHVVSAMELRKPQRNSLARVHELISSLPSDISDLPRESLSDRARQIDSDWEFTGDHPSLTFALATGVGKTRLIGAIAAYLFRTGQSRNFVILAPRDAILRKFESEIREASPKYLFVDPSVVPQPRVCHRGNILNFRPSETDGGFLPTGPNVFIFSPQLLVRQGRVAEPSEFAGTSMMDYLQSAPDLVVFVDESHHLSSQEREEAISSWGGAVAELAPKLVLEMTAAPREGAAVAHEYGLAQCLRERLYTKAVRMIVDDTGSRLTGEEYDEYTLRFAMARLREKQRSLEAIREEMPGFPEINPVLLVSAQDTRHADQVGDWLVNEGGFEDEEVLVIHSKRKTEEDMARIAAIERPDSPVRVVVQVHVLDEGWDVTNVYVISPLRNVNSYVNARQMMGRGLRLPAGRRVDSREVDTLDVLAFGQSTFEEIYGQATDEFGPPDDETGGLDVVRKGEEDGERKSPTKSPDDPPEPRTKVVPLPLRLDARVELPVMDLVPPEPSLDVEVASRQAVGTGRTTIDLGTLRTASVTGDLQVPVERFEQVAVDQVFRDFIFISDPLHRDTILSMVREVMEDTGAEDAGVVRLDPVLTGKVVAEALQTAYRTRKPEYRRATGFEEVHVAAAEANVPLEYSTPLDRDRLWVAGWSKQQHGRIPVAGWNLCIHETAHFDSKPEFEMAYRLDHMEGVEKWLRNEPGQIAIPTLAGNTRPDFVVWLKDGRVLLLEIKGEYLWEPRTSDSWVRARDVKLWVEAAERDGVEDLEFAIVLGANVDGINSIEEIFDRDALDEEERR